MKEAAVSGMFWVFIDAFLVRGVSFIGTILLARLLSPNDFGLIAMIAVFVTIGVIVVDSGLSSSLIRNIKNEADDFCTVFFCNIFLSLILYVTFFFLAPLIANFYSQETLKLIIRIYCLSFFFSALSSVQTAILIKNLKFKRIAFLNIPGVVLGNSIGLILGMNGFGVWSIVGMYLSTQFFQTLALWLGTEWKPSAVFSIKKLKFHYAFGSKLFISSLITSIFSNIYNLVIGKLYPLKVTGYFDRAFTFNQYPLIVLMQVIGKVTLPLLASIQDDKIRLSVVFKRLVNFTFFVTAPVMLILSAVAKPLILLIFGNEWLPIVPILQILCFGGLFSTLKSLNVNILQIHGRSDLILKSEIRLKIFCILAISVGYFFGFYGIVWSVVVNSIISLLANMFFASKVTPVSIKDQLATIAPIFLISLSMFYFINVIQAKLLGPWNPFSELIILSGSGLIFYLLVCFLFKVPSLLYAINLLKKVN